MIKIKSSIYRELQKRRNSKIFRFWTRACRAYLRAVENESVTDFDSNGERILIKRYADFVKKPLLVFDVGANVGEWAQDVLDESPDSQIFAFELVAPVWQILNDRFNGNTRVECINIGLSDLSRDMKITYFPKSNTGSSLEPLPWKTESELLPARVIQGDEFCEDRNIDRIDLLKIDTEGHDLLVLKGFRKKLERGKINMIQFEYGYTCIPSRCFLKDFYELLNGYDYKIGKLYADGVVFKDYDIFSDESFRMNNFVAVCDETLVNALSAPL